MPARKLFPMLSAADLERSLAFDGDLLGGRETYRVPTDGPPQLVVLAFAEGELGLGPADPRLTAGRSPPAAPATSASAPHRD